MRTFHVFAFAVLMSGVAAPTSAFAGDTDSTTVSNLEVPPLTPEHGQGPPQATGVAVTGYHQPGSELLAQPRVMNATQPLSGPNAWLVAGAIGVLVPLLLFAVPALVFAWFGPFAPVAFLVGLVMATLTTAAGGALAWAVSSIFSNVNSGFFLPVTASALVGLGATLVGGVMATGVILAGLGVAWAVGPAPNYSLRVEDWSGAWNTRAAPVLFGASALAFLVWGAGVMVATVGGPMTAAYLYRENGTLKRE